MHIPQDPTSSNVAAAWCPKEQGAHCRFGMAGWEVLDKSLSFSAPQCLRLSAVDRFFVHSVVEELNKTLNSSCLKWLNKARVRAVNGWHMSLSWSDSKSPGALPWQHIDHFLDPEAKVEWWQSELQSQRRLWVCKRTAHTFTSIRSFLLPGTGLGTSNSVLEKRQRAHLQLDVCWGWESQLKTRFYPGKLLPRPPCPQTMDSATQEHPSQQTLAGSEGWRRQESNRSDESHRWHPFCPC